MRRSWAAISAIASKDLKVARRDQVSTYVLAGSLLLAGAARLFLPLVEGTQPRFAALEGAPTALIERLEAAGRVELCADEAALRARVLEQDDAPGLMVDAHGALELVLEGDEAPAVIASTMAAVRRDAATQGGGDGPPRPPIRAIGLSLLLYAAVVLVGSAMGLGIVEERESGAMSAMSVTPLRFREYVIAKLAVSGALAMTLGVAAAWVAIGAAAPLGSIALAALGIVPITWLFGLAIGAAASNQLAAMAAMKGLMLVLVSAPVVGFMDLGGWAWLLTPFAPHWGVQGMFAALSGRAPWAALWAALWAAPWVAGLLLLLRRRVTAAT
jgi:ABC-2 type transport system permease protein